MWWAAAQLDKQSESGGAAAAADGGLDALLAGLQALPPARIADEALGEWLKFFAGHKLQARDDEGA